MPRASTVALALCGRCEVASFIHNKVYSLGAGFFDVLIDDLEYGSVRACCWILRGTVLVLSLTQKKRAGTPRSRTCGGSNSRARVRCTCECTVAGFPMARTTVRGAFFLTHPKLLRSPSSSDMYPMYECSRKKNALAPCDVAAIVTRTMVCLGEVLFPNARNTSPSGGSRTVRKTRPGARFRKTHVHTAAYYVPTCV